MAKPNPNPDPSSDRPNVLLIQPDQMGATWMGVYGHPEVQTPRLDAFARQAATFERAYTVSPLCTPARGSLWTGQYPGETGVRRNHDALRGDARTVAHAFNHAGYDTMYLGKWHLSGGGNRGVKPEDRGGFARFYGWEAFHVDHWDGQIWGDDLDTAHTLPGHETDGLTDVALDWLDETRRDRPFFMTINYQAPHAPCSPPDQYADLYRGRELQVRPNVDPRATMRPQYGGETRPEWNTDWRGFVEGYYGEITHLDTAFGRLLDTLDRLGLADRTIVAFTSDHGENAGAFGRFEKHTMNEESIRIPMLIHDPRCHADRGGFRRSDLFSNVDLTPTLLDLCGLPALTTASGVSHAAAVCNGPEVARQHGVSLLAAVCIYDGRMKLETDRTGQTPVRLIDLDTDPYEMNCRLDDPAYEGIAHQLHERLTAWRDAHDPD
ncbi:MAG: sulfatase-like hydrolase/transferase [Planctomycetota bacterium]